MGECEAGCGQAVLLSTLGVALTAYALPTPVGGNGYLSASPAGIVLGNRHLPGKHTLIPAVSRQLNMIDENADVPTTFTDSTDEVDLQFVKLKIRNGHPWQDQYLRDLQLPPELLVVLLLRGGAHLVPDGATAVQEGDVLVLCAPAFQDETVIRLSELTVKPGSKWIGQRISSIRNEVGSLVIMIQRGGKTIVPNGQTILRESDVLVLNQTAQSACP